MHAAKAESRSRNSAVEASARIALLADRMRPNAYVDLTLVQA